MGEKLGVVERYQALNKSSFAIAQSSGNDKGKTQAQAIAFVLDKLAVKLGEKEKDPGYIPFTKYVDKYGMDKPKRLEYFEIYRNMIRQIFIEEKLSVYENDMEHLMDMEDAVYLCTAYSSPGVGPLEKFIRHPEIYTDIHIQAYDKIFYETRLDDETRKSDEYFINEELYIQMCAHLAELGGVTIDTGANKYQDFEVFRDRYSLIAKGLSRIAYAMTIRIHPEEKVKYEDCIKQKTVSEKIAEETGFMLKVRRSILYGGVTGSGKTTYLNAQVDYVLKDTFDKILVTEDTPELAFDMENVTYISCEASAKDKKNSDAKIYTLSSTIFMALRQKPRYVFVGECRNEAFMSYIESVETGHATDTTGHGVTEKAIVNRIVEKYIQSCPNTTTQDVKRKLGESHLLIGMLHYVPGRGRRMITWTELVWNEDIEKLEYNRIWKYDAKRDNWDRIGKYSSEMLFLVGRDYPAIYEDKEKLAWFDKEEGDIR